MMQVSASPYVDTGIKLYRRFLQQSSGSRVVEDEDIVEWEAFVGEVSAVFASGRLSLEAASAIQIIATNVCIQTAASKRIDETIECAVSSLSDQVRSIAIIGDNGESSSGRVLLRPDARSKRPLHDDSDRYRTSKRSCRPTTTKYLPTPSPPPSIKSLKPSIQPTNPAPDPVRQYFLTHLASPYPTPSEKEKLCKKAKITRRKLESDLTNWRRRSDWTDIMNTYCGGDKGAMKVMVGCIERGEERDVELLERYGRMKAYLEKRDEQAGEWVYQVCPDSKCRRH